MNKEYSDNNSGPGSGPGPGNDSNKKTGIGISRFIKGFAALFWGTLWRYLVAGLMVWVPLIVTIWVTWLIVKGPGFGIEKLIRQLIHILNDVGERVEPLNFLSHLYYVPGLGFLVVILVFLTTGLVAHYLVTRKLIRFGEWIVERIPLISTVYRAVQQIRDVFISREGAIFQKVCLVEYPRPGLFAVAFVTSHDKGIVQEKAGRDLVAIFLPTTPNPTSGYLLYVPPDQIIELNVTVEDAMKLIVSGGAYIPPELTAS